MTAVARDQAPLLQSHQFLQLDDLRFPDSHFGLAFEILDILFHAAVLNKEIKATITGPPEATAESHTQYIRHQMLDIVDSRGFKNVEVRCVC